MRKRNKAWLWVVAAAQVVSTFAVLVPQSAEAAQITSRSLSLSDSTTGQTPVTYTFTFTPTTATAGVIAFKFCSEDPLQGTTCTTPTGMVTTTGTGASVSGQAGATWTPNYTTNGNPYFTGSTAAALTAGTTTATFNTFKNPTALPATSYYAKIWTCATTTFCADNAAVDYGAVAWDIAAPITVTAKVQETLTFCTYVTGTCAVPTGSTVDLGILSTAQTSAALSKFEMSTNAQNGVSVQYFGSTLTSGANTIAAAGGTAGTIPPGTEKFGLNLAAGNNASNANIKTPLGAAYSGDSAPTGTAPIGSVSTTPTAYATAAQVAFVTSASAPATTPSTRTSQTVAFALNPINQTVFTVNYMAAISNVTKPGIYTTTVQYVATGSY